MEEIDWLNRQFLQSMMARVGQPRVFEIKNLFWKRQIRKREKCDT
jgi:hypothetical protein